MNGFFPLPRARRGFTLIELLIVIVIIAILALLIIPRLMSAGRRARESALTSNLYELRLSIQKFQSDTGVFPASLVDLVAPVTSPPTVGGGGASIPAGTYRGPYYMHNGGLQGSGLPVNPFKSGADADYGDWTAHWAYDENTGNVWAATPSGDSLDGVPYSHL
jgi:general secretion pathway protein G